MKKFKLTSVVSAVAATALLLTGCASGSSESNNPADQKPIQAVVFGGIGAEGILKNNSITSVTAAEASVAAVNAEGGINGRLIKLTVVDDTGNPTVAVTKLRQLLSGANRPDVVMNSGPSTVADALVPILTQEKIFSFNIGPTATTGDPNKSPYNFDLSPSAGDYLNSFMEVMKDRGYKKVGVLHGSTSYGENFGKLAAEKATAAGFTLTGKEGYVSTALDMTAQIEKLKAGNPDVVILDAYGAPVGYVLQGFKKIGWNVPIMANNSVAATGLISTPAPDGVLGTDLVKNLTMQVFKSTKYDKNDTKVNTAVKQMLAAGEIKSSLITAYNYDAMPLFKAAVKKAGSLQADAVAKAMIDPEVQKNANTVLISLYNFTAQSHTPNPKPNVFVFIAPGPLVNGQFQ